MEGFSPVSEVLQPFRNSSESLLQQAPENQPTEESHNQPTPGPRPTAESPSRIVPEAKPTEELPCQEVPETQLTEESPHQEVPEAKPTDESSHQSVPEAKPNEESPRQQAPEAQSAGDSHHQNVVEDQPTEESACRDVCATELTQESQSQQASGDQSVEVIIEKDNDQDGNREPRFFYRFRKLFHSLHPQTSRNPISPLSQEQGQRTSEDTSTSRGEQGASQKQKSLSRSNPADEIHTDPESGPSSGQARKEPRREMSSNDSKKQTCLERARDLTRKHWKLPAGLMFCAAVLQAFLCPATHVEDEVLGPKSKITLIVVGSLTAVAIFICTLMPYVRVWCRKRKARKESEKIREEEAKRRAELKRLIEEKAAAFREKRQTSADEGTSTPQSESTSQDVVGDSLTTYPTPPTTSPDSPGSLFDYVQGTSSE